MAIDIISVSLFFLLKSFALWLVLVYSFNIFFLVQSKFHIYITWK